MLKLLDLFSGIGGFSLGLEQTKRIKTIAFVEKDKFCQKVLKKNFKNIPIEEDIRNVKGSNYAADIVSGGFPCQPFSVAGKRKGTDDDRYLWDETIRVVRECKPRWFIGENVEGIVNINNGLVLRQVQTDLEKEGFKVQCLIIPASGIGAWHQRKRVWIIGCNVSNSNLSRSFKEYSSSFNRQDKRDGSINESSSRSNKNVSNSNSRLSIRENEEIQTRRNTTSIGSKNVPNSNSRLCGGRGTKQQSGTNESWGFYSQEEEQTTKHIRSKIIGCDALPRKKENVTNSNEQRTQIQTKRKHSSVKVPRSSSKKSWWQIVSKLCGVPNGVSYELDKDRTNRIKSLGNSIVPQIAYEIGKAIINAEDESN
jgi:DNA (cytosine-5)-methyltransferase 1